MSKTEVLPVGKMHVDIYDGNEHGMRFIPEDGVVQVYSFEAEEAPGPGPNVEFDDDDGFYTVKDARCVLCGDPEDIINQLRAAVAILEAATRKGEKQ